MIWERLRIFWIFLFLIFSHVWVFADDSTQTWILDEQVWEIIQAPEDNSQVVPQDIIEPLQIENVDSPPETLTIPEIILTFQRPSYIVETSADSWWYECDSSKWDCKVNFSLEDTFWGYVPAAYTCTTDFWFSTWEENKCNPNTVVIPEGEHQMRFTIFEKNNSQNAKQKNITIKNIKKVVEVPQPIIEIQSGLENSWEVFSCKNADCKVNLTLESSFTSESPENLFSCEWDFGWGVFETQDTDKKCNPWFVQFWGGNFQVTAKIYEKNNWENYQIQTLSIQNNFQVWETPWGNFIPDVFVTLQSPSYVLDPADGKQIYYCDDSKPECKINFDLSQTFWGYISTKFACENDFGFVTGEEQKCNPATIVFPKWEHTIHFQIYEKNNPLNQKSTTIFIKNIQEVSKIDEKILWDIQPQEQKREIVVQSWWEIQNGKLLCNEEECKVNLKFSNKSYETCEWSLGNIRTIERSKYSCNPSFFYVSPWNHRISFVLTNTKTWEQENYFLDIQNQYVEPFVPEVPNIAPVAKITLQGKIGKNKTLKKNSLICYDEQCSVNLTAEESFDPDSKKLSYFWEFGNGEIFEWKNPTAIKFFPWKYTIILTVRDEKNISQEKFFLEVLLPWQIPSTQIDPNILKFLKISAFLPNPVGTDSDEWIELKNIWFAVLNLKWLVIDDVADGGSRPFQIENDTYLLPFAKKKFYKYDTKINLDNSGDTVQILYNQQLIDSLSRKFKVKDNFILTPENLHITSQKVEVVKVIDGDTIKIKLQDGSIETLRLIWVDTPETVHPKKVVEFFGIEASNFTKISLTGKMVFLETEQQNYRDKYGRLLGYIRLEDSEKFFNLELIEKWYARAYLYFPFKYLLDFEAVEKQAKKDKVGMWSDKEMIQEIKIIEKEETEVLEEIQIPWNQGDMFTLLQQVFDYIPEKFDIFWGNDAKLVSLLFWISQTFADDKKPVNQPILTNFTATVSKLKSGVKISGKTYPEKTLFVHLWWEKIPLKTDNYGRFSYLRKDDIPVWEIKIHYQLEYQNKVYDIGKQKLVLLTQEYVDDVVLYNQPKPKKVKKTTVKKAKKVKVPKPQVIGYSSKIIEILPETDSKKLNHLQIFLYIFWGVWGILWVLFLLRKKLTFL